MDFFFFFLPDPERAVLCVSARYSFAMEDAVREQALLGRYCAFTVTPGLPFLVQLPDFFMFLYTLQWEVTLWHLLEVGIGKCVSVLFLYNKKGRAPFFFCEPHGSHPHHALPVPCPKRRRRLCLASTACCLQPCSLPLSVRPRRGESA